MTRKFISENGSEHLRISIDPHHSGEQVVYDAIPFVDCLPRQQIHGDGTAAVRKVDDDQVIGSSLRKPRQQVVSKRAVRIDKAGAIAAFRQLKQD